MRERMFSVQSLHQDNATAPNKIGGDSFSALDAYYIRENYQVCLLLLLFYKILLACLSDQKIVDKAFFKLNTIDNRRLEFCAYIFAST